jgi:hypothetical protein
VGCFKTEHDGNARDYVVSNYDHTCMNDQYSGYNRRLVRSVVKQVQRSAHSQGATLTTSEAKAVAIRILDHTMASGEECDAIFAEHQ